VLLNLGYRVSGSDQRDSEATRRLQSWAGKSTSGIAPSMSAALMWW